MKYPIFKFLAELSEANHRGEQFEFGPLTVENLKRQLKIVRLDNYPLTKRCVMDLVIKPFANPIGRSTAEDLAYARFNAIIVEHSLELNGVNTHVVTEIRDFIAHHMQLEGKSIDELAVCALDYQFIQECTQKEGNIAVGYGMSYCGNNRLRMIQYREISASNRYELLRPEVKAEISLEDYVSLDFCLNLDVKFVGEICKETGLAECIQELVKEGDMEPVGELNTYFHCLELVGKLWSKNESLFFEIFESHFSDFEGVEHDLDDFKDRFRLGVSRLQESFTDLNELASSLNSQAFVMANRVQAKVSESKDKCYLAAIQSSMDCTDRETAHALERLANVEVIDGAEVFGFYHAVGTFGNAEVGRAADARVLDSNTTFQLLPYLLLPECAYYEDSEDMVDVTAREIEDILRDVMMEAEGELEWHGMDWYLEGCLACYLCQWSSFSEEQHNWVKDKAIEFIKSWCKDDEMSSF